MLAGLHDSLDNMYTSELETSQLKLGFPASSFDAFHEATMTERVLKSQISVFGRFHFPPIPQTTIQLTQAFQTHSLMPSMVNTLDANTGQFGPKLCLQRAQDGIEMLFADDRIDISQNNSMQPMLLPDFVIYGQALLNCLSSYGLRYSRLALVRETLVENVRRERAEEFRKKLLPNASESCIEWVARWVDVQRITDESFNVCYDLQKVSGFIINPGGAQQAFDGLKFLSDISTKPEQINPRFENKNTTAVFEEMQEIYAKQRSHLEFTS